jgi:hypothetical protein
MSLAIETLPGDSSNVAVLYGPLVLAGELGTQDMPSPYARGQVDQLAVPTPEVPAFVTDESDLLAHIKPVSGRPLAFRTEGLAQPAEVSLVPFYSLHHQRYTAYWRRYGTEEWRQIKAERAVAEARTRELQSQLIDSVRPGDPTSEKDHNLQGENTQSGPHEGRHWRHAAPGWFSWDLVVRPDAPVTLLCTFWGSDVGRKFDVLVDGHPIATVDLNNSKPGQFLDVEYPIPADLTKGKQKVTVRFQSRDGAIAGGVFICGTYRTSW